MVLLNGALGRLCCVVPRAAESMIMSVLLEDKQATESFLEPQDPEI